MSESKTGELAVLNCAAGDLRVNFNKEDAIEVARARKMIQDMLARGYIIAIEVDGGLEMIQGFDPKTDEYIIVESAAAPPHGVTEQPIESRPAKKPKGKPRGAYVEKRVKTGDVKATAAPPTAGG